MKKHSKAYNRAAKRVKKKREFYNNLISYIFVMVLLMFLNLRTSPFHLWFLYPMIGWGIALAFQYVKIFGVPGAGFTAEDWEEAEIRREMRKMGYEPTYDELPEAEYGEDELELKPLREKELRRNYREEDLV